MTSVSLKASASTTTASLITPDKNELERISLTTVDFPETMPPPMNRMTGLRLEDSAGIVTTPSCGTDSSALPTSFISSIKVLILRFVFDNSKTFS
ncbi:hypothetical protein M758_UG155200 [Ceratodon purpureus]|nr:hypothetical protein M758_UG155200 [Ceratodon purpureus]